MGWWLARTGDQIRRGWIKRFDARFWTVNFPRPMMASVVTTGPDALRVDAVFYRADDLAGLIWEAEDRLDHPLLAYETARDFRGCQLSFRWLSGGLRPLDAVNGPTLTIEGRDAGGHPRSWYVRLWNYATGTPDDALVVLDFNALDGGFTLPGEADPVYAGDIDRMFISLVPPGYVPTAVPLAEPAEGWLELSDIQCEGRHSTIAIGDAILPEHGLRIANGYDDSYNVTPARLLRNMLQLGYRDLINHYVGMSHYFRLLWNAGEARFIVDMSGDVLNAPCRRWHQDFVARAKAQDMRVILSLSYELFDAHAPEAWKQRAYDGSPALTGWSPPSTLLSPASTSAMAYLYAVGRAFIGIAAAVDAEPLFQIGEPWWWVSADGRPHIYDAAARAAFGGSPPEISTVRSSLSPAQTALLDAAGHLLGTSTLALRDAVKTEAPPARTMLLFYAPQVLDHAAPELVRANMPAAWVYPAFDVLQLEDYDFVIQGDSGASQKAFDTIVERLGYAPEKQHYFSGFVLNAADRRLWRGIDAAAEAGRARGAAETFVWACSQVIRDGFVHFDEREAAVQQFHDVSFPLELGLDAVVSPGFSTAIITTASGREQRNAAWADARMSYDAGLGVRSEEDLRILVEFFRARRGPAAGFRLRDPIDNSSAVEGGAPAPDDQWLGTGDGVQTRFALLKHYGLADDPQTRRITRPLAGSVMVSIDGVEQAGGWTLDTGGWIAFALAPSAGAEVRAGFRFDVPVRFADDRLSLSFATFRAGEVPNVNLVEIKED